MSDEPEFRALTLRMPPDLFERVRASAAEARPVSRRWGADDRSRAPRPEVRRHGKGHAM